MSDEDRFVFAIDNKTMDINDGVLLIDGYINHGSKRFHYQSTSNLIEDEYLNNFRDDDFDPYGEWLSIRKKNGIIEVKTDFFGFYRVFYSKINLNGSELLLISNCFNSLSHYVSEKEKTHLNVYSFYPLIASFDNYFINNYCNHTANSNIFSLRPDQKIIFDPNVKRLKFENRRANYEKLDFENLIDKGNEFLIENLKSVEYFDINLYFSGGNDSRLCLSVLLSNINRSRIGITTAIPTGNENSDVYRVLSDDFKISNLIRKDIGLEWYKDTFKATKPFSPESYFDYISKYRSNNYFSALSQKASLTGSTSDEDNEIQIRGGGGELLRTSSYYKDVLKKTKKIGDIKNNSDSVKDDLSILFNTICVGNKDSLKHAQSQAFFIDYVNSNRGKNIEEKLNYRYYLERNNRHFGHHREKLATGKRTFFPLANPYWYSAEKDISFEELKDRKLVEILYSSFDKELLDFPFTGQKGCENIEFENDLDLYKEFMKNNKSVRKPITSKSSSSLDIYDYIKTDALRMIDMITDYSIEGQDMFDDKIKRYLIKKMEFRNSVSLSAYMKVRSVFDSIYPSVTAYTVYR